MSFCMRCGRPLKEGETCTCQQQPQAAAPQMGVPQQPVYQQPVNQQQAYQQPVYQQVPGGQPVQPQAAKPAGPNPFVEYINIFKGLFTAPVETVSAFVAKVNIVLVAILIGGEALINMLTKLFDMLIANSKAKVTTGSSDLDSLLAAYTSYTSYKPYETGAIFKYMFLEILLVAVSAAVFALVVMLLAKAFNKANVTYVQGLATYGILAVLGVPAKILSWVIDLIPVSFFSRVSICTSLFATVAGYVFVFMAIRALCKDEKKIPVIMGLTYVAVSFATWVIRLMF